MTPKYLTKEDTARIHPIPNSKETITVASFPWLSINKEFMVYLAMYTYQFLRTILKNILCWFLGKKKESIWEVKYKNQFYLSILCKDTLNSSTMKSSWHILHDSNCFLEYSIKKRKKKTPENTSNLC